MNKKEGKRGQVTIFIIIAILIIVLGILIYLYYPKIFSKVSTETKNPSAYIQECMQQKIEDTVETISLQGGSVNPEFYYSYYNGEGEDKIEYLCYTNQNYQKCIVQEPQLIAHIEQEILDTIEPSMENCFTLMVESYEKKGYDVGA